jgi:Ca2+/Na+ antiporter
MRFAKRILANLPIIIALILLGSAPLFILQEELYIANQLAGFAFYSLIVGVIWKIIQYLMNRHQHENEITENRVETQT